MTTHGDGVFVGREGELERLCALLEHTLAGQGQVAFVTGEAGSGKTALVHHFCRQAQTVHTELVVALGQCDAQTGTGTPYLPFVEILQLLTGDNTVEDAAAEALSQENVSRLRSAVRFSRDAIFAFGPDLIDALVPGSGLVITAGTFIAEQTGLSDRLQQRIRRQQPGTGITQENIFEQYSNVVRKLAASNPLVLVLDDLHWADAASCQLLFRLARRIEDRPVLVLGTYRPNDVAAGRPATGSGQAGRHPLEPVTTELARYYGDIWVELDGQGPQTQKADSAYEFVSSYIDAAYEPHSLDEAFVRLIASRTEGHPLFVVELLRDLAERGWLARDRDTQWALTRPVTFDALPARVEGIIAERIGRLDLDARELLTIAAVEGGEFTAQVVAQVQRMDERAVVRRLSRELDRQHRLVAERGVERAGRQRLHRFGFRHILFQTHLYNSLGEIDRSLLHEDVGMALEGLYGDQAVTLAVQLSYHFLEAGLEEQALPYLIESGEQARRAFANQEAVDYYTRALSIIDEMLAIAPASEVADWQQMQFEVLGKREEMYDRLGERNNQAADLERMRELAGQLGEHQQAQLHNRRSRHLWATSDYDQAAEAALTALRLTQAVGDRLGEGEARLTLGRTALETGDYDKAFEQLLAAVELFAATDAAQQQAEALIQIGALHSDLGQWEDALPYFEEALDISRQIDSRWEQAWALDNIGIVHACTGDYSTALHYSRAALTLAQTIGNQLRALHNIINLGLITAYLGDYEPALALSEQALLISRAISDQLGETSALISLGNLHRALDRHEKALAYLEQALDLAREIDNPLLLADCHYGLAVTCHQRKLPGDSDQAIGHALEAIAIGEWAGFDDYQVLGYSWLAVGYLAQGETDKALLASTRAVKRLEEIGAIEGAEEEVYFNHFQVLQAAHHPNAWQALQQAERILREKAERISDPLLRQSYLEQVSLHRRILRAAADHR